MAGHRSTLKKNNKPFKSGHSSKRSIKAAFKGKVEKENSSGPKSKSQSRTDRKNKANQLKQNKVEKTLNARALFDNGRVERIVTFIPLTSNVTAKTMVNQILKDVGEEVVEDIGVRSVTINRFKSHWKVILPDCEDMMNILDACKVSDIVVFGLSATEEVDPKWGEQIIRATELQGIPTIYGIVTDVMSSYPKKNLQQDVLKSLSSYFGHFFPDYEKLYCTENTNDSSNLLRKMCQKLPKSVRWRDARGYMVADSIKTEDRQTGVSEEGYLVVEGTVRGQGFNVNHLVSLQGLGDFLVDKIETDRSGDIYAATEERETLDSLLPEIEEDDDMSEDGEEDQKAYDLVNRDATQQALSGPEKKLPNGISGYQANWLLDDEIDELIEENGEAVVVQPEDDFQAGEENRNSQWQENLNETADDASEMIMTDLSPEEEAKQLEEFKKRAQDELEFPDEIDISPQQIATQRLARYRGVKSLSDCLWDYDEEDAKRPEEWKRYLRVKQYAATRRNVLQQYQEGANVKAGTRCRLYIVVPASILSQIQDPTVTPFVVYGLASHEHKLTVCNFSCKTWESYELPVKSKEKLWVQYGFHRVAVEPIFSQPSRNGNHVAKFLRYLQVGSTAIATVVAPISFTNSPALFFRQNGKQVQFVAEGTFLDSDYTRIIAKRSVLTGEVYKINRSTVTVRYMFFHDHDVEAYRNVPLFTKMGRSGLIKQSLGTHGYFKATFDGKLNAQDIIAMALYKRMWPRYVY